MFHYADVISPLLPSLMLMLPLYHCCCCRRFMPCCLIFAFFFAAFADFRFASPYFDFSLYFR